MCGIAGKVSINRERDIGAPEIRAMMDAMAHRGPDSEGLYLDGCVGLGHRRLSIIDLSRGHQPISNEDESIWIVFNGEIYNFESLRDDLEQKGHTFKTRTDTEVIIHCYEEYGQDFLEKLRGMFGFAIWDSRKQRLVLARDRVGIKPVYFAIVSGTLIFASEIKALLCDRDLKRELNPDALYSFLNFYYTPGDSTLFKGIEKLLPGHYMVIENGKFEIKRYWSILDSYKYKKDPSSNFEDELNGILEESVRLHMISDVPVGFLLSGGVDSTGLLSYAVAGSKWDIKTFTIGFEKQDFADERFYALLAAKKYGLEHHELTISKSQFFEFLPNFIWYMEEPVCEPPAVSLYFVSKLAGEYVKVLISGEGGDEAFAGYPNYRNLFYFEKAKSLLGGPRSTMNHLAQDFLSRFNLGRLNKYVALLRLPFEQYYFSRTSSPAKFFKSNLSNLYGPELRQRLINKGLEGPLKGLVEECKILGLFDKMLFVDLHTWLPDDLLIKADRMTMANSLELRVPFLDHKVLEFAASLPISAKLDGFTQKKILKNVLMPHVPPEIIKRKKAGFPIPYQRWLKSEWRSEVFDLLLDRKTLDRGYFEKKGMRNFLEKEYNTNLPNSKEIFSLMCLEMWHRIFIDKPAA